MLIDQPKYRNQPNPHTDDSKIAYGVKSAAKKLDVSDSNVWKLIAEGNYVRSK